MTRQYFCWKVSLTFRCGCVEYTSTAHRCPADREGCNTWLTYKRTDKNCEEHRGVGWGLNDSKEDTTTTTTSSSSSSSSTTPVASEEEAVQVLDLRGYQAGSSQVGGGLRRVGDREGAGGEGSWEGCYVQRRA